MLESTRARYSYNFSWLGMPIFQYPQDLVALQEIVWNVRPQVIVETGVARGGSLVFYAGLLRLIDPQAIVVGVDIDIRPHNRQAILAHPLAGSIRLIDGSSIAPGTVDQVAALVNGRRSVMVCLDSHHAHDHVLAELEAYAGFVTPGSYLVVLDTAIEHLPPECSFGKPWGQGNSPASAVQAFLSHDRRFAVDQEIDAKLQISVAPGGYLRRLTDTTKG